MAKTIKEEPTVRLELTTYPLRRGCSAIELHRHAIIIAENTFSCYDIYMDKKEILKIEELNERVRKVADRL